MQIVTGGGRGDGAGGLVAYSKLNVASDTFFVAPTPEFYRRSIEFADRVNDLLADAIAT